MAWTRAEYEQVRAWRAGRPPLTFDEIAARLGGRSGEAVRQKLISEHSHEVRGGRRPPHQPLDQAVVGPRLGERTFQRLLLAGGGHSRFTEIERNPGCPQAYPVMLLPMIGPDGRPRPCADRGCQCVASRRARPCGREEGHVG
jgi:hypothetical protein